MTRHIFFKMLKGVVGLSFLLWGGGFVLFLRDITRAPRDMHTPTDAIVVLTGGSQRIEEGLDLLRRKLGKHLFITGVGTGFSLADLGEHMDIRGLDGKVELGHQARDTRGNALETAHWLQGKNYQSLRVVTSDYHLPRSLLEFKAQMPTLHIIPHPVTPAPDTQGSWRKGIRILPFMVGEYTKFVCVFLKFFFEK